MGRITPNYQLKADRPHPHNYPPTPTVYSRERGHRRTDGRTDGQTDGQTDGRTGFCFKGTTLKYPGMDGGKMQTNSQVEH